MLVLSRKTQQVVRIGDAIKITVLRVRNGVVSIGIDAPKEIQIWRDEITPWQKPAQAGSV